MKSTFAWTALVLLTTAGVAANAAEPSAEKRAAQSVVAESAGVATDSETITDTLTLNSALQRISRLSIVGQEYYAAATTSTEGVSFVLGVNRPNNRQLWLVDTTQVAAPSSANAAVRFLVGTGQAHISGIATDGFTPKALILNSGGGNVGIGTLNPTQKLHVAGNAYFSGTVTGGNIEAAYQDLAEWVPSSSDLEPGTVVVVDPAIGNGIKQSLGSYDTAVAGVISSQPGILLGEAGDEKERVATTGRVRMKVDATRSPIRVGDLLVTSDKPGRAMKSIPVDVAGIAMHRPGTIVGKALEPLAEGEGEILVLLSLQ